ncbi:hypothetical protein GM418_10155 [Maribellus comscasis]|uniref:Uncharacterized protein n=1 Tax=Maribellus comscasis TaxID=2681766 RepID=A0A6I6JMA8_9BACT|nr:hypothetical protein [Maribellus comscasis]QGY44005.1 hypothetical protein GM418_10155 [Maribellus comscasis]
MKTFFRNKLWLTALPIALGVILFLIVNARKEPKKSVYPLNVMVTFDETKFVVQNCDTIDFVNATLSLNEYYKINGVNLKAGENYTIWPVEFVHSNGKHFSKRQPLLKFSIWCELNDNNNGFYNKKFR